MCFCGVTGVHLGSALLVWEQNSTKPRVKDKLSLITKQSMLDLLALCRSAVSGWRQGSGVICVCSCALRGASPSEASEGEGEEDVPCGSIRRGNKALLKTVVVITLITAEKYTLVK